MRSMVLGLKKKERERKKGIAVLALIYWANIHISSYLSLFFDLLAQYECKHAIPLSFSFLRPGPPTVPRSGGFPSSPGQGKGKKKVYACTRLSLLSFLCRRTSSKMFVLAGKVKEEEKSVNVLVHHPMTGPMLLESHASQG